MADSKNAKNLRVFVASLCHETSAFSPIPTTRASFEAFEFYRPEGGVPDERSRSLNGYGAFIRAAESRDFDVYASTYSWAQPSAPTVRADYEALRGEILEDLERFGSVDMVLLFLHGAQMAEGYDDCEGDLLSHTRAIVGQDCFVGALLDLHANVSPQMVEASSALVACRNYPHTDFDERAEHLFKLGLATVTEGVRPTTSFLRVPMVGMFYTTEPLMSAANDAAQRLQDEDGMLSVSLTHGFTWSNTKDTAAGVIAISDGNNVDNRSAAEAVAERFFAAREETQALRQSVDEVLDEIEGLDQRAAGKPYVIADACDNAGGGAGSDSTFILRAVLERGIKDFALGLLWDPQAVGFAAQAGTGAKLDIRIGGKTGPCAGDPLDVTARVVGVFDNLSQHGLGFDAPMGRCVVLDVCGNAVILNTVRGQVFSPSCFIDCGIDPMEKRAVVVKSSQHFYDQFEPLARKVFYCETPGALSLSANADRLSRLVRPIWPLDDVEFGAVG